MKLLNLKLLFGFLLLFLFVRPAFAQQQYFFQEEFNQERPAGILDSDKWIIYSNKLTKPTVTGCLIDTVNETSGVLILKQCSGAVQFPYVHSKGNPFPSGNFTTTVGFQFTLNGAIGTGVKFVTTAPPNGTDPTDLFGVGFYSDIWDNLGLRFGYKGEDVFKVPANSGLRVFKLSKENNIYKMYYNDQVVFTSPPTEEKIGAVYMGNPAVVVTPGYPWSWPRIDYIRVIDDGPSEIIPQPFLELPWDYKSSGKEFKQIILNPNSWFDHKYPLQNYSSSTLGVVKFTGKPEQDFYKSHSGYDYGSPHGVIKNTEVLAAAAGKATFIPEADSGGAGNMIKIDHGNGYQTWYEHLEENTDVDQLIVDKVGEEADVTKGQKIGRVGLTGNTTGYHIHLSVFKDVNNNGDFSDDHPFGLVDPLGWEGDYTDPWEEYSNEDKSKHGAKSYKLFTDLAPPKTAQVSSSGGAVISDKFTLTVPENASSATLTYRVEDGPFEQSGDNIRSAVPSLFLSATNNLGLAITTFNNPLGLIYDYSKSDLSNLNEDSLSFYYFNTQTNLWEKLSSSLNKVSKTISSQTTHFSQFAVMGEVLDSSPPTTSAEITGTKGNDNWYLSNVTVNLNALDNPSGKGTSYTVYSYTGNDWEEYTQPLEFTTEGAHKIYFLSHDLVGNEESVKTLEFIIDKTPPEVSITSPIENSIHILNSEPIQVNYSCTDTGGSELDTCLGTVNTGEYLNTNIAGETLFTVEASDKAGNKTIKNINYKIQYAPVRPCGDGPGRTILQPVNPDGTSVFKQGSTVPVKFRICDNQGTPISDPNLVKSFTLIKSTSNTSITTINEPVISTTPDLNFRYDSTNQQWIFNMKTKNLTSGKSYFYKILLNDQTEINFNFTPR